MSQSPDFAINLEETFRHLPRAPIAEAIIDLRAKAEVPWEEAAIRAALEPLMTGYTFLDSQQQFQTELKMEQGKPPQQEIRHLGWKGLRYQSSDKKNIAEFNRDGFVFRRLPPYEDWQTFQNEAVRLWAFYLELSKATQVQRIGLRFVNRIVMSPPDLNTDNYLSGGPKPPEGLDFSFHNFMHHDTWAVPSHPFAINVIRAFQALPGQIAVILDIDVFSTVPFELQSGTLEKRLAEMRWLKNKTFFGIVNPKQIEQFAIPK